MLQKWEKKSFKKIMKEKSENQWKNYEEKSEKVREKSEKVKKKKHEKRK